MNLLKNIGIFLCSFYCVKATESSMEDKYGGMRFVCYAFQPHDIASNHCTHIVYRNAELATLDVKKMKPPYHKSLIEKSLASPLRDHKIKVLLQVIMFYESANYTEMGDNDDAARSELVSGLVNFVRSNKLDGLELRFFYHFSGVSREPIAALVRDLSDEFKKEKFLLAVSVSQTKETIDERWDVKSLARKVDWLSVDTVDYYEASEIETGHTAPLYYYPEDQDQDKNIDFTINYLIKKGSPPEKLVMMVPSYGQLFTLDAKRHSTGLHTPSVPCATRGRYFHTKCYLEYDKICDRVNKEHWTVVQDPERRMGPYAYKEDEWVSYDDPAMLRRKVRFAKSLGLGGIASGEIDFDDGDNSCGDGKYPLLTAMAEELMAPFEPEVILYARVYFTSDMEPIVVGYETILHF